MAYSTHSLLCSFDTGADVEGAGGRGGGADVRLDGVSFGITAAAAAPSARSPALILDPTFSFVASTNDVEAAIFAGKERRTGAGFLGAVDSFSFIVLFRTEHSGEFSIVTNLK